MLKKLQRERVAPPSNAINSDLLEEENAMEDHWPKEWACRALAGKDYPEPV